MPLIMKGIQNQLPGAVHAEPAVAGAFLKMMVRYANVTEKEFTNGDALVSLCTLMCAGSFFVMDTKRQLFKLLIECGAYERISSHLTQVTVMTGHIDCLYIRGVS